MTTLIRRHPVTSYFVLAIVISWGGILAIVLPGPIPASAEGAEDLFVAVYLAMLAGPTLAGLGVAASAHGKDGLRQMRARLLTWRVDPWWYVVALFAAPAAIGITVGILSMFSDAFLPAIMTGATDATGPVRSGSVTAFALMGLAVGIGAGFFEELGWSGVATPRLLQRHAILWTGVSVGIVWGAWHFLAIWWGSADAYGSVPVWLYLLVALFSFLPPYRVLMTWVYRHTNSLLIGILMHASLTTSMLVLGPPVSGAKLLTYDLVLASTAWIAVALVLWLPGGRRVVAASARPRSSSLQHGHS